MGPKSDSGRKTSFWARYLTFYFGPAIRLSTVEMGGIEKGDGIETMNCAEQTEGGRAVEMIVEMIEIAVAVGAAVFGEAMPMTEDLATTVIEIEIEIATDVAMIRATVVVLYGRGRGSRCW